MTKVKVYNLEGKEVETLEVSDNVFALPKNDELVHQVAVALMGNKRQVLADTKTRGERAGSGIKPWRQKGTGRARVGSVRTPIWRKGGVVFGPNTDRNFKKKINKKMNAKAIALVLSGKLRDEEIFVVDSIAFADKKTKSAVKAFTNLEIKDRALVAFSSEEKDSRIATRNIDKIQNILTSQLNVLDMLNNKNLVMSKESVKFLEEKYGKVDKENA
jgi:large subunit ribosomal protein L4